MSCLISLLHFLSAHWRGVVERVARDFGDVRAGENAIHLVDARLQFLPAGKEGEKVGASDFGGVFSATGPGQLNGLVAQTSHHFLNWWR